jgi:hypothetical protein
MMCINTSGAAELLDVSRVTIWRYCVSRRLHSFSYGVHHLIPLRDIAKEVNTTQKELLKEADRLDIPVWRCKGK